MRSRLFISTLMCIAILFFNCGGDDVEPVPILEGDLVLNSQEAINEAARKKHTKITGSLIISDDASAMGSAITDLSGLSTITCITGDLIVRTTRELTSLTGLEGLEELGGNLTLEDNRGLRDLDGLRNITRYSEPEVEITDNFGLVSISGLQGLQLAKSLEITVCNQLSSLEGLHNLRGVSGDVFFGDNRELATFNGLTSLRYTGDLGLFGNDMRDLSGLEALDSVAGTLRIFNFNELTDLSDLSELSYIKSLSIIDNPSLTTTAGMTDLRTIAADIEIRRNPALIDLRGFEVVKVCEDVDVESNESLSSLTGLNGLEEVLSLEIQNNPKLTDLLPLKNLDQVFVNLNIGNNGELRSLLGLEFLTLVDNFNISGNALLTDLGSLQSLVSLSDLSIADNPALTNLDAFDGISQMDRCNINRNASLSDFCGIANIDIKVNFQASDNAFNPTEEDLANGNCRN